MNREEEKGYWRRVITEMQKAGYSLEKLAYLMHTTERQILNWKAGHRPTGIMAVRLFEFRRDILMRGIDQVLHSEVSGNRIL